MMKCKPILSYLLSVALLIGMIGGVLPIATVSADMTSGDFSYVVQGDGTAKITGYAGSETQLIIPDTIDGYTVASIGHGAFRVGMESVTIPSSVTSVEGGAFVGIGDLYYTGTADEWVAIEFGGDYANPMLYAENEYFGGELIKDVVLSDGVAVVGAYAFCGCDSLTSVTIPSSVERIGSQAFERCTALTAINVADDNADYRDMDGVLFNADGKTLIAYPAAKNNTSYTIPDGVECIESRAFAWNKTLTDIVIGDDVRTIQGEAFWSSGVTNISISDSVQTIGYRAFFNSSYENNSANWIDGALYVGNHLVDFADSSDAVSETLTVREGTKTIQATAFVPYHLTDINIPDSVTNITTSFSYTAYAQNDANWENGLLYADNHLIKADPAMVSGEVVLKSTTKTIARFAFSGCSNVTGIVLPDKMNWSYIGWQTFYGCSSLTTFEIPDTVTGIDSEAFYGCSSLTGITIPDNVTSIGESAFAWCSALGNITVSESVTSIGKSAFIGCDALTDLYYNGTADQWAMIAFDGYFQSPSNPMYYAENEYFGGELVTDVVLSNAVSSIGDYAFTGCDSLKSITIPDGVTEIGNYAFNGCTALTSVTVGNGVTTIGDGAFYRCNMETITIPNSVKTIGAQAFAVCAKLTSVTLGSRVTSIGSSAFGDCEALVDLYYNGTADQWVGIVFGYDANPMIYAENEYFGDQMVKNVTLSEGVECVNDYAFADCASLESVTVPGSLTSIGREAFSRCASLQSIVLGEGIDSIGDSAFEYCSSLTQVTIPNSVTYLGTYAFEWCGSLQTAVIGQGIETINNGVFYYCGNLKNITLSDHIRSIGNVAFKGCAIESLLLSNGVDTVGEEAFANCDELSQVILPASLTVLGDGAFSGCNALASINVDAGNTTFASVDGVLFDKAMTMLLNYPIGRTDESYTIPDGVTAIQYKAFYGCLLQQVTIPASVTAIDAYAFNSCSNLADISITDNVAMIGSYAFSGTAYHANTDNRDGALCYVGNHLVAADSFYVGETVAIKDGTKTIAGSVFDNCSSLVSVSLPQGLVGIGEEAFKGCRALTSVTVPSSVTAIGERAFANCDALKSVYISDMAAWFNIRFAQRRWYSLYGDGRENDVDSNPLSNGASLYLNGELVETLVMPDGATSIGGALEGCVGLKKLYISDGVTVIDAYELYYCSDLQSVYVPDSVTQIGKNATPNALTEVYYAGDKDTWCGIDIQDSRLSQIHTDYWGGSPTLYCNATDVFDENGIRYIAHTDGTASVVGGTEDAVETLTIPAQVKGYAVSCVEKSAFEYCTTLTSVVIGENVKTVGDRAFYGCTALSSITLPDADLEIGNNVFENTAYVNDNANWMNGMLYIGKHLVSLGWSAFTDTVCIVADGTLTVTADAVSFANAGMMIPESVVRIGSNGFGGPFFYMGDSTAWKNVSLDESEYGYRVNYNCESVAKQDGMTFVIHHDSRASLVAFNGTQADVTIPDAVNGCTVTTIETGAFSMAFKMMSITIPKSVTSIGIQAFYGCDLTDVYYGGTESEWNMVKVEAGNSCLTDATFHFADEQPTTTTTEETTTTTEETTTTTVEETTTTTESTEPTTTTTEMTTTTTESTTTTEVTATTESVTTTTEATTSTTTESVTTTTTTTEATTTTTTTTTEPTTATTVPAVTVITITDSETAVSVSAEDGVLEEETTLSVALVSEDENGVCYDILLLKDGVTVQPNGEVTVSLPVPEGKDGDNCKVYFLDDNGEKVDMNAVHKGGMLVFVTTHFSKYVIEEIEEAVKGDLNGDGKVTIIDAVMLYYHVNGKTALSNENVADMNDDGKINISDAVRLYYYVNGKITDL